MFSFIWHTFFFDPIYNGLVFLIDIVPGGDVGIAIILVTIVVKLILLPLSLKAVRTQRAMQELDPKVRELRERFKDKREELARRMMELYREAGVNPFAFFLLMLIQVPITIALYLSIFRGGGVPLPDINVALLYGFVPQPETITMLFLGIVDIAGKSLPLALLAGLAQYYQTSLSFVKPPKRDPNAAPDLRADFARSMQIQMRYILPVVIFYISYVFSAAIALYFIIYNAAGIAQEFLIRRERRKHAAAKTGQAS